MRRAVLIKSVAVLAASIALSSALSSCGFQLRDQVRLPQGVQAIRVESPDRLSGLAIELKRALYANDAGAADGDKTAAKLEIISESLAREILSVNDRARVSEFVLIGKASARLMPATGDTPIIAAFDVAVRREYSFDEAQALGASQEEEIISAELKRELAELILLKLGR